MQNKFQQEEIELLINQASKRFITLIFRSAFFLFAALMFSMVYIQRRGGKLGLNPVTILLWEILILFLELLHL